MRARVVFRKQVSDGNYGTEAAEVALDVPLDDTYELNNDAVIAVALETVRRLVHAELARSPSSNVRRALEQKVYARPAPDDEEDLVF